MRHLILLAVVLSAVALHAERQSQPGRRPKATVSRQTKMRLSFLGLTVRGNGSKGLDWNTVHDGLVALKEELGGCLEVPAVLRIRLVLGEGGSAKRISVDGTRALQTCVKGVLAKAQFAKADSESRVSFELHGEPGLPLGARSKRYQVLDGDLRSIGDLPPLEIRDHLRRKLGRLRSCYETETRRAPKLRGTIALDFTIIGSGRPTSVKARGVSARLERCVSSAIREIQFPRPKGGGMVQVQLPLTFEPVAK